MLKEKSSGAIIFCRNGGIKYLLLHYESGHWDFVKGNVEKGETEEQTAIREIEEETGIKDILIIDGFREVIRYFYKKGDKLVSKEVVLFLAVTQTRHVRVSWEHVGYKWLDYENALKVLTFNNSKQALRNANEFLLKAIKDGIKVKRIDREVDIRNFVKM